MKKLIRNIRKYLFYKKLEKEYEARIWNEEVAIALFKQEKRKDELSLQELKARAEEKDDKTGKQKYDLAKEIEKTDNEIKSLDIRIERSEKERFDKRTILLFLREHIKTVFK